ncbi:MAG: D-allose transporter substrate-binding protein [Oscillospiraceae bacterium]|nr:D-allose transporter substrate-binding protein [Oscillospiraceae bacterium]
MKKNSKKLISVLLALAVVFSFVLAACSKGENNATTAAGDTSAAGETSANTASGEAEYAVILKTLSNDFWATMKKGIEEEAAKQGIKVDIFAAQSEEDTEGQLRIFENCLAKNYKAIGVAPLSPTNLINGIVQANKKGIYVMNIDEKIDMDSLKSAGGSVIAFATTDNVKVGEKGANFIIDKLTDGGEVAIIEGKAGNASGEARKQGATAAFEAKENIKLVGSQPADWDRQKALDTAASMIQQNPDLKAIYCCNDTMALGALQAVKNAGKLGEIIVVGTDGAAEALKSVEAGELSATVAQDSAEIGATSLRQMIKAVNDGAEIDPNATPDTIPVDSYIVEKK